MQERNHGEKYTGSRGPGAEERYLVAALLRMMTNSKEAKATLLLESESREIHRERKALRACSFVGTEVPIP
jgi:hypothetical protein